MRLAAADVASLPLAAAFRDASGTVLAHTPEWRGLKLGSTEYAAGGGRLTIDAAAPRPVLESLVELLLAELSQLQPWLAGDDQLALAMFSAALELHSGRFQPAPGSLETVVAGAELALRRRTGLTAAWRLPEPGGWLPAPELVALVIEQIGSNAERHAGAKALLITVDPGPTIRVAWPGGGAGHLRTSRHPGLRERWGMGFTRRAADALGAVVTGPSPLDRGWTEIGLGLGLRRLNLPCAHVVEGRVAACTRALTEEPPQLTTGSALPSELAALVARAMREPGRLLTAGAHAVRSRPDRGAWLVIQPEDATSRALDLLRGFAHERHLLHTPEAAGLRIDALLALIQATATGRMPSVTIAVWEETAAACGRLAGVTMPRLEGLLRPDPRLVAYLLAETGGSVTESESAVFLDPVRGSGRLPPELLRGRLRLAG